MPENWKTYNLGSFCKNISRRFDFSQHSEVVFINTGDVLKGKFLHSKLSLSEGLPGQAKKAIRKGDILFSEIRPKNERYAPVDFEVNSYVVSTKFMVLVVDEEVIDRDYFIHCIKSPARLDELQSIAEGRSGTFPQITFDAISTLEFNLPPIQEQRAIANILSAIDDKIENNLAMNKTLEDMAMALYKHWFVDFGPFADGEFVDSELGLIPKGWEVKRLDCILEIKYGKDHKKLEEGSIPVYGTGGIMRYVNQLLYDQESILIPRKGSLNNLYYLNQPFWTVDTLFYSKIKLRGFGKYAFHFLKTLDLASMDVGSAIPSLTTQLLNRINVVIPPNHEVLKYDQTVTIWFNTIQSNIEENETLISLRDTLLPKLISGEVRLKEFQETIANVL